MTIWLQPGKFRIEENRSIDTNLQHEPGVLLRSHTKSMLGVTYGIALVLST